MVQTRFIPYFVFTNDLWTAGININESAGIVIHYFSSILCAEAIFIINGRKIVCLEKKKLYVRKEMIWNFCHFILFIPIDNIDHELYRYIFL